MSFAFYTVLSEKPGYPVKHIDSVTWRVKTLVGPFGDPGEASQEFQARIGGEASCYLSVRDFRIKARLLAQLRRKKGSERNGKAGS